jgi:hypothetical protein
VKILFVVVVVVVVVGLITCFWDSHFGSHF